MADPGLTELDAPTYRDPFASLPRPAHRNLEVPTHSPNLGNFADQLKTPAPGLAAGPFSGMYDGPQAAQADHEQSNHQRKKGEADIIAEGMPKDAIERAKGDPEYAERLKVVQSIMKVGGHGGSDDVRVVADQLLKLPPEILKTLKEQKTKVVVCRDSVADYRPDMNNKQPRGWPPGTSWNKVPGMNDPNRNEVVISTTGHDSKEGVHVPRKGEGHGSYNMVLHEVLHAVENNRSEKKDFNVARDADTAQLIDYEKQKGIAGQQETFAEAGARFYGSDPTLKKDLPKLYDYFSANPFQKKKSPPSKEGQSP